MDVKRLTAVSVGHLAIDLLNSSVAMVITALAGPFQLRNSQIGAGVMVYGLFSSLSQPLFGWLADRLSGRWLGAAGLVWTATFFALATRAPNYPLLLVTMALAALGSSAFHPQGAMNAGHAGHVRASSATAFFFLLGQIGLALGPAISGLIIQRFGLAGIPYLAGATLPAAVYMAYALRRPLQPHSVERTAEKPVPASTARPQQRPRALSLQGHRGRARWLIFAAFALLVAARSTVQQGFYGLLPKFLADRGYGPGQYGLMVAVFSTALALGTLLGGILGDRMDHRRILVWAMLACAPFSYAMLNAQGWLFYGLAAGAGLLVGMPHSIQVVMAQKLLPGRQGLASGAVLGFMFASGAAGTGLAGWIADWTGLSLVLHGIGLLPLVAGLSALLLREAQPARGTAAPAPVAGR